MPLAEKRWFLLNYASTRLHICFRVSTCPDFLAKHELILGSLTGEYPIKYLTKFGQAPRTFYLHAHNIAVSEAFNAMVSKNPSPLHKTTVTNQSPPPLIARNLRLPTPNVGKCSFETLLTHRRNIIALRSCEGGATLVSPVVLLYNINSVPCTWVFVGQGLPKRTTRSSQYSVELGWGRGLIIALPPKVHRPDQCKGRSQADRQDTVRHCASGQKHLRMEQGGLETHASPERNETLLKCRVSWSNKVPRKCIL